MRPLAFNGKFLAAAPTGVHRVAEELIRATDAILEERGERRAVLLHPPDIHRDLPLRVIPQRKVGRMTWQFWEQADLPRHTGPALLINLCNLGPVFHRNAVTMIHDAQVHETPASYGPAFRKYYKTVQPMLARRHRAILTVSDYSRKALTTHHVAQDAAVHVVPNGVDHVARIPPNRGAPARFGLRRGEYALALASAQPHKNTALLIDAFRRPEMAQTTLALFGASEVGPDAPPNVCAVGRVSDADLYGLMSAALAFLSPSTTEGFGLPPLEAMALGAPVVAAPGGAMPEVLGDAPIWAAPQSAAEWAKAILSIRADATLRFDMSAKGAARAAAFTWRRSAERLIRIIDELDIGKGETKWLN